MYLFYYIGLYFRTLRHLKPIQIIFRIRFWLIKPRIKYSQTPEIAKQNFTLIPTAVRLASLNNPSTFFFLNQSGNLDEVGWQDEQRSKLWRYNQHYFDDLNAIDSRCRKSWHIDLIDKWIKENSLPTGVGWDPYPTSLRIVNWIKWSASGNELSQDAICSLAIQTRWLVKRIEWHLLGNHLLANAKALVFAGIYFEGFEAQNWLSKGMKILENQVPEQVLKDGGHFELSPMYHALAIEDLLDLINLCRLNYERLKANNISQVQSWVRLVPKMLVWLRAVSHPDERISFFNDAAFGIAPENSELINYAERLGFYTSEPKLGVTNLKQSGLVRLQSEKAVVIFDLAQIGPDYLPGHGHADTLSFELSVYGKRVFVNSGTSMYGTGKERLRQRGTSAHNTILINGQDSSEVWSGFRVGSRAKISNKKINDNITFLEAYGTHDGYARKNGGLLHTRHICLSETSLKVYDTISQPANAEAYFHLHPEILIYSLDKNYCKIVTAEGQQMRLHFTGISSLQAIKSTWHPEFGVSIDNYCLLAKVDCQSIELLLEWD